MDSSTRVSSTTAVIDALRRVSEAPAAAEHAAGDKLRIFLSHKERAAPIAEAIKEELEAWGADRLEIFLSEGITYGDDWSERIHCELERADWLFLLYTEPTADYDWCLYEAGFFAARRRRRLICLYSAGLEPPGPLKVWQSVQGVRQDWSKLLKELYGNPPRPGVAPLNSKIANNESRLSEIVDRILQVVGREPKREYYNCYFLLTLDPERVRSLAKTAKVPEGADVESNAESFRLFGLGEPPHGKWRWGDLTRELEGPGQLSWITSLGTALRLAYLSKNFAPGLPLFESRLGPQYRPVVHRLDRMPSGGERFMITLIKQPREDDPMPPSDLGRIYALLRMARILRWGILVKYSSDIQALRVRETSDDEIDACLEGLALALQSLEAEARRLKMFDLDGLVGAFRDDEDKKKIPEMFDAWAQLRRDLTAKQTARDLPGLLEILTRMRAMNKAFLVMGARRSIQLIEKLP